MVIRTSPAHELERLVADLRDTARRDAAVARLRVLGPRAISRLSAIVRDETDADLRRAALWALEGMEDARAVDAAAGALRDTDERVRLAAITVLRPWVLREQGTRVLDGLVTVALDAQEYASVRVTALDALSQLPSAIVGPIAERAAIDVPEPGFDDPGSIGEWLERHADAPLSSLHQLVALTREREGRERDPVHRQPWLAARGTVHAALARRESRVALYDLREAFGAASAPLPLDFLTAIAAIGDVTCLEPMARAWAAAPPGETWWRARVSDAARALVARHRLTGRHAAVKRLQARWPGFLR